MYDDQKMDTVPAPLAAGGVERKGAIEGKTNKTVVLHWFSKIEYGGCVVGFLSSLGAHAVLVGPIESTCNLDGTDKNSVFQLANILLTQLKCISLHNLLVIHIVIHS